MEQSPEPGDGRPAVGALGPALLVVAVVLVGIVISVVWGSLGAGDQGVPIENASEAMLPTFAAGETLRVDPDAYADGAVPARLDVVIFRAPPSATETCGGEPGDLYVKRVVGLPGERVVIGARGGLRVDGRRIPEPEVIRPDYRIAWPVVPAGHLIVLGDNRPGSCDSHQWRPDPFVPIAAVAGKVRE